MEEIYNDDYVTLPIPVLRKHYNHIRDLMEIDPALPEELQVAGFCSNLLIHGIQNSIDQAKNKDKKKRWF